MTRSLGTGSAEPSVDITVLLPVRNAAATLPAALTSLSAQTLDAFTVLILDDGSTDGSLDVARDWARRDPRFVSVESEPRGIVRTLQEGLSRVRTEFVARMDADDVCLPRRLAVQSAFLRERGDLVGCGAQVVPVPGQPVKDRALEYLAWLNGLTDWESVERDLFVECPLAHPTFFFRAEALRRAGGYRDRSWPEDYDLLLRLWRLGGRYCSVPEPLLEWGEGDHRLSKTHPAYSTAAFARCRLHHLHRAVLPDFAGVAIWGSGPTGKLLGRLCPEVGVRLANFVDVDPRKIGQEIHGVPVLEAREAASRKGLFHLGAVARKQGRESLRRMVRELGLEEGVNFRSVA
ncbi:MAG: glycosyltransferase [Gemmatimonadetes bacterium]|nr:glycosyltransferase [Gemmatimonadota bacterium]